MDWKQTLGNLAPAIGSAFGPLGVAGGLAVKQLLGLPNASDAEVLDYIQTPEGAFKLKQAEYDYNLAMQADQTARMKIEQEDRASARVMQGDALKQEDLFSKRFIYYFTIFWSAASTSYIGFITFYEIPASNIRFADTILGFILGTAVSGMFSFFYGSTSSGKIKDATIANLATNSSGHL